jgi:SAM-dependent methyltransferase
LPTCCYADEYGELFSARAAHRTARRYLRRGLRGSERALADGVAAIGLAGATVLEVGGGVGQVHTDLLRRGAASATNIELSPGWEAAATWLLTQLGLRERVQRRLGDFVDAGEDLRQADIVVLHRVVCCYPDWPAMISAASARTGRCVALTLPADRWWNRLGIGAANWLLRVQKRSFRAYVHPWDQVVEALEAAGFRTAADHRGLIWRTVIAERVRVPAGRTRLS